MAGLAKSAVLEGPTGISGKYTVVKTKNTLDPRPGQVLTEKEVESFIRASRIDLTINAPKKK